MTEKLTEELLDELLFSRNIENYFENEEVGDNPKLSEYLNDLLVQKNLKKNEVIKKSKLNGTFAYQILNGERNPSRNKILQFVFAMDMTLKETQRALKYGGVSELYPKNKRDAIIIYCLNNKLGIEDVDDSLYKFGEKTINEE